MAIHNTNLPGDIIYRLRNDDPKAFDLVYRQYYGAIFYLANRMVDNTPEAEDVTQNTFIKFWNYRTKFETPEKIKAFLYITASNACRDCLKIRKGREKDHRIIGLISKKEATIENEIIRADLLRQVYQLAGNLPDKQQKVFKMLYVENRTYKEVEEELDMSPTTVRMHKSLALKNLKNMFGANSFLLLLAVCSTALKTIQHLLF